MWYMKGSLGCNQLTGFFYFHHIWLIQVVWSYSFFSFFTYASRICWSARLALYLQYPKNETTNTKRLKWSLIYIYIYRRFQFVPETHFHEKLRKKILDRWYPPFRWYGDIPKIRRPQFSKKSKKKKMKVDLFLKCNISDTAGLSNIYVLKIRIFVFQNVTEPVKRNHQSHAILVSSVNKM